MIVFDGRQYGLGRLPSPPDRRDYPARAFFPAKAEQLPEEYTLPFLPPVLDQGTTSMCVDFSLRSLKEAQEQVERGLYAPLANGYIYGNRAPTDWQGEGMYPREALNALIKFGLPPGDAFNALGTYEQCRAAYLQTKETADRAARPQRIERYVRAWHPSEVQGALYHLRSPVLLGASITKLFAFVAGGDGLVRDEPIDHFGPNHEANLGGHAMTIVGWRRISGRLYWIVQNSWGASWGDGGRCYMPADWGGIEELWAVTDARPRGRRIRLPIGESRYYLVYPQEDGSEEAVERSIDVGALIIRDRTVLPVRHTVDALNALLEGQPYSGALITLPNIDARGNVVSVDLVIPDTEV